MSCLKRKIRFKINPVYEKLIPSPSIEELVQLETDIKKHGILNKIIINQKHEIIDGYTRYKIGQQLGIKLPYEIKKFKNTDAELQFLISTNIHRRHLRPFQKVKSFMHIYEKLLQSMQHGRKVRAVKPSFTKMIGVSPTVLTKCLKILREGTKEQIRQVENNEVSVQAMYRHLNKNKMLAESKMCPLCHGRGILNKKQIEEFNELRPSISKSGLLPLLDANQIK